MMLELHQVTIGQQINKLSLTLNEGQLLCITGTQGAGKTTLLRTVLGFIPVDEGFICIDGEQLTPLSAPFFRRQMAYVPQYLSVPEGYIDVPTDYIELLRRAVKSGKPLLIVDEPSQPTNAEEEQEIDRLLKEAVNRGASVLAVNSRILPNPIRL
jgi:ABC-type cobalamin/Fe3+-siderophores transport system ATPase subunit